MGKGEELTTTKYLIHAQINANGIVEKPDVVGAVFGQTEGLLSNDLDLRELQRTGRIGRIQVMIHSNGGRAKGEIVIPSSLDRVETAILAASLETINRVGPCEAEIHTVKVEDVRAVKREQVVNRAKEIYKNMIESASPASMRMIEEVRELLQDDRYSKSEGGSVKYRVPVEEFFTERRNRLLKYFTAILSRKLNDEKMPFA